MLPITLERFGGVRCYQFPCLGWLITRKMCAGRHDDVCRPTAGLCFPFVIAGARAKGRNAGADLEEDHH